MAPPTQFQARGGKSAYKLATSTTKEEKKRKRGPATIVGYVYKLNDAINAEEAELARINSQDKVNYPKGDHATPHALTRAAAQTVADAILHQAGKVASAAQALQANAKRVTMGQDAIECAVMMSFPASQKTSIERQLIMNVVQDGREAVARYEKSKDESLAAKPPRVAKKPKVVAAGA